MHYADMYVLCVSVHVYLCGWVLKYLFQVVCVCVCMRARVRVPVRMQRARASAHADTNTRGSFGTFWNTLGLISMHLGSFGTYSIRAIVGHIRALLRHIRAAVVNQDTQVYLQGKGGILDIQNQRSVAQLLLLRLRQSICDLHHFFHWHLRGIHTRAVHVRLAPRDIHIPSMHIREGPFQPSDMRIHILLVYVSYM